MEKWWHVKRGVPLTDGQKAKAVDSLIYEFRRDRSS